MKVSQRVKEVPYSAIRKLTPYADAASQSGKKIYHLNIGEPDTRTPEEFFEAIKDFKENRVGYAPSKGLLELREATSKYYKDRGIAYNAEDEIIITAGASEALYFALISITDLGDNVLTCNPFYSNYYTIFRQIGIRPQTFDTKVEDGYQLPDYETILSSVNENTKAILLSNPSNPTGAVYTEEEIRRIARVAIEKDLFIIADEVYREFVYDNREFMSFGEIEGIEDRLILLDSISKRFGACGARIGSIASKNQEFMTQVIKLATGRLAAPTLEQIGATRLYDVQNSYFKEINEEYQRRRDCIYEELKKIDGVKVYASKGAFYVMPELPVEDAEDFAKWLLTDFDVDGETVMVAPGFGFYHDSNVGKSQIRLAFVLNCEDLRKAINLLKLGLDEYKKRKN